MNNVVKEPLCTHCTHSDVCMHKNDYLSILKAVSEVTVAGNRLDNFDFIKDISIGCRYCQDLTITYRGIAVANGTVNCMDTARGITISNDAASITNTARGITISNDMASTTNTAKVSGRNEHHL